MSLNYHTVYGMIKIVMNTNVLFAGLYSADGASFQVLQHLADGRLQTVLSTPLLFEYEDVLKRNQLLLNLQSTEIEAVLDNLCAFSQYQKVYFLWRPYLPDAKDDLVLELAMAARIKTIVTYNLKDFVGIDRFGVEAITPKTLLERLA
jgi:putative PIN family toxin of toxin-antitoxin system